MQVPARPRPNSVCPSWLCAESAVFCNDYRIHSWDVLESVKNKKSEEAVLKRKISLKNGAISLTLENELELSIFEDLKNKLHGFLKKKFNKNIDIITSVTIKKKEKTIYTNKDKFEYLSKQNSNLEELKNKLGLDYEY